MQVWIMTKGERYEGGFTLGVYFTKEDARDDFVKEAQQIQASFGVQEAWVDKDDESVHVEGGCDWLSLSPADVKGDAARWIATPPALPQARSELSA